MSSPFEIGRTYSREAISEELGGNPQWALPRSGGKVVCVCLKPENNPDAPRTVLVTEGPEREKSGRLLAEQEAPIPVFLQEDDREWRYIGLYESTGQTTDTDAIEAQAKIAGRGRPVVRLVFLEATENGLSSGADLRVFEDSDDSFFEWMSRHPNGLVLNTTREKTAVKSTLHQSNCSHISPSEGLGSGAYTERGTVKVCAEDAQVLKEWIRIERPQEGRRFGTCDSCNPPVDSFEDLSQGSPDSEKGAADSVDPIENERRRRREIWKRLCEAGGPEGVEADLLRRLRIYRGQAGIWTDKEETEGLLPEGGRITVSVLHTGEHYPDGLSEEELIYQYPETNRPGTTDANEIEATKNAALGDIPIFVILSSDQDQTLRDVRWGKVTDWNDEAGEFLIQFSSDPGSFEATSAAEEEPFRLTEDLNEKKQARHVRRGQVKFRFEVRQRYGLRCAVCDVETRELLEAAHIRDRSKEGSNDPRNGLLLCRNHHKAFDDGLFGICPDTLEIYLPGGGPPAEKLGITRSHLDPKQNEPHPEAIQWAWEKWKEGLEAAENTHPVE